MTETTNNKDHVAEIQSRIQNMQPIISRKEPFINMCCAPSIRISTGWKSLDIALNGGLCDELYILAAETSTGKSALLMSIAQNIAQQGINVLYFALEMSSYEYIARGISSISFVESFKQKNSLRFNTCDILYWTYDYAHDEFTKVPYSAYSEYAEKYFSTYGEHLYIIESSIKGLSANDIASISAIFKQIHPTEKVVVFVDYLQIIKADANVADRKTKTDTTVTTLKTLASQIGMPVVTVSSIGRSSYNGPITTSCFKESGDTEYTGGILIGWNWKGVTDTTNKEDIEAEKRACNARGYRKMVLDVLKFRNAKRDNSVRLVYFPAYNFFIDIYDWHPDICEDNPFTDWNNPSKEDVDNIPTY